jgi:hypothetical protein
MWLNLTTLSFYIFLPKNESSRGSRKWEWKERIVCSGKRNTNMFLDYLIIFFSIWNFSTLPNGHFPGHNYVLLWSQVCWVNDFSPKLDLWQWNSFQNFSDTRIGFLDGAISALNCLSSWILASFVNFYQIHHRGQILWPN